MLAGFPVKKIAFNYLSTISTLVCEKNTNIKLCSDIPLFFDVVGAGLRTSCSD